MKRILLTGGMTALLLVLSCLVPVPARGQQPNYDESKVPSYTLPDPLVRENGKAVRSRRAWERKRRPELLSLFSDQMFGVVPPAPEGLHFKVVKVVSDAFGGLATMKEVEVCFDADETQSLLLLLFVPNAASGPVPAFLGINFRGNHATTDEPYVSLPSEERMRRYGPDYQCDPRGVQQRRWPYRDILSRGYAVATFYTGDVDPDYHDGFHNGVHGLLDGDKPRTGSSWATISAWAWGLSRALDYLETDPDVDGAKVAVIGHSRLGKTALWAGATDPRFALVVSNNSGCGGAALSKRCFGETVGRINQVFPHWFCDNFKQYGGKEDTLPFDQHELLALIAPRPLYVASASEDLWADPHGEYLSLIHAAPVYRLYGEDAVTTPEMPAPGEGRMAGKTAYHLRPGPHDINIYDWSRYMDFADRFLK